MTALAHDTRETVVGTDEPDGALTLRVAALPASAARVRATVSRYAAHHSDTATDDVALAVSEAVSNAIVHAYVGRTPGCIHVGAFATSGNGLVVSVTDNGLGMRPRPDSPGAGLGLTIIAGVADALRIDRPRSGGTRVSMRFDAAHGEDEPRD
jgi:serine/threonine-protein kinase RsbW/stage II sporulation protein AB (anti-sigma F factor)